MIHIDQEKCTLCKSCVSICHTTCLSVQDERVFIERALCSTCCQCGALGPSGAITSAPREFDLNIM